MHLQDKGMRAYEERLKRNAAANPDRGMREDLIMMYNFLNDLQGSDTKTLLVKRESKDKSSQKDRERE